MSLNSAIFNACFLLLSVIGILTLLFLPSARRIDAFGRAMLLGAAWVILGGMTLCNLFSYSSLFAKS